MLITATIAISYFIAMVFFGAMSHCFGPESFENEIKPKYQVKDGDDFIVEKELEESGVSAEEEKWSIW